MKFRRSSERATLFFVWVSVYVVVIVVVVVVDDVDTVESTIDQKNFAKREMEVQRLRAAII